MRHPVTGKWIEVKLNRDEIIWAAGFFDGEETFGCYINKGGKHNPRLLFQVVQKELYPLVRFNKAILGLGKFVVNNKGINILKTHNFEHTQTIMALLWNFLTPIKREQYKRAIKLYNELYDFNIIINKNLKLGNMKRQASELKRVK